MEPYFRKTANGSLDLTDSPAALHVKRENQGRVYVPVDKPEHARSAARNVVLQRGGNPSNEMELLGKCLMQIGVYKGQSFRWVFENSLGYAAYLVHDMLGDVSLKTALSVNKNIFKKYVEMFSEGIEAVKIKSTSHRPPSRSPLSSLVLGRKLTAEALKAMVRLLSSTKVQPSISRIQHSAQTSDFFLSDRQLLTEV